MAQEELDVLVYPDIGMEPLTYFMAFARLAPVQVRAYTGFAADLGVVRAAWSSHDGKSLSVLPSRLMPLVKAAVTAHRGVAVLQKRACSGRTNILETAMDRVQKHRPLTIKQL